MGDVLIAQTGYLDLQNVQFGRILLEFLLKHAHVPMLVINYIL